MEAALIHLLLALFVYLTDASLPLVLLLMAVQATERIRGHLNAIAMPNVYAPIPQPAA